MTTKVKPTVEKIILEEFDKEFAHMIPSSKQRRNKEMGVLHYEDTDNIKDFIKRKLRQVLPHYQYPSNQISWEDKYWHLHGQYKLDLAHSVQEAKAERDREWIKAMKFSLPYPDIDVITKKLDLLTRRTNDH